MVFNHTDTLTFPANISGAGNVIKNNSGTTILTGNNTYTNGTTINSGVLSIGSANSLAPGNVNLTGGTLKFSMPAQATIVTITNPGTTVIGSASFSAATGWSVTGGGNNVWAGTDQCEYVYVPVSATAPGTWITYISSYNTTNTDGWAKTGIMARASLTPGTAAAFTAQTDGNGVQFQYGNPPGGNAGAGSSSAPHWMELTYDGNGNFSSYYSNDAYNNGTIPTDWAQIGGTQNVAMPTSGNIDIGLFACAHNNAAYMTGVFGYNNFLSASLNLSANNITSSNTSTIDLGAQNLVQFGTLALQGGALTVTGSGLGAGYQATAGATTVSSNTTLNLNTYNSTGYGQLSIGPLGGAGNLTLGGAGLLILTGADGGYSGNTNITGGTLQVGAGGNVETLGANAGPITIGAAGTLAFARSDTALVVPQTISGSGNLAVISGAVTLSSASPSVGGLLGSGGLILGNAAAPSNTTLTVNPTTNSTFAGSISDALTPTAIGSLVINGGHHLTFTGTNTYSGTTTVNASTLTAPAMSSSSIVLNSSTFQPVSSQNSTAPLSVRTVMVAVRCLACRPPTAVR